MYSRYLLFKVEVLRLTDLRWQKKNLNHGLEQKTNPQKTLWIFSNVIMKRLEK